MDIGSVIAAGLTGGMSMLSTAAGIGSKRESEAHQKRMFERRYQMTVKDMRKAGLNPILAARGSMNPGSVNSTNVPGVSDMGQAFASGLSSSASVTQAQTQQTKVEAEVEKIDAEIDKIAADIGLTQAQTNNVKELTTKIAYEKHALEQQAEAHSASATLSDETTRQKRLENLVGEVIAEFKSQNPNLTIMQAFGIDGGQLMGLINNLIGGSIVKKAIGKGVEMFKKEPIKPKKSKYY